MNPREEAIEVAGSAVCLYDLDSITATIARMGREISGVLADSHPLVLTVLNGGIPFAGALLLQLPFPLELDSLKVGRYQGATAGSTLKWHAGPQLSVRGRTILLVDDILDEGITLLEVHRYLLEQGAAQVYSAVLVEKNLGRQKPYQADFVGLVTDNVYLFGFGLDYKGQLRNWPGLYACLPLKEDQP